jgi:hypothetical protein
MVDHDVELAMVATYPVPGGYCREFSLFAGTGDADLAGLACRNAAGWQLAAREAEPDADPGTHYAPAAGDDEDAIRASLDARGAGLALSPEQEAAALAAGWR